MCSWNRLALVAFVGLSTCGGTRRSPQDLACPAVGPSLSGDAATHAIKTIFVIVLENQDWGAIRGSRSAPYINGALLPRFAHVEDLRNGGLHPSLGNYIALEAGSSLGVTGDEPPAEVHLDVPCHLTSYLDALGLSWKAYAEGIGGDECPIEDEPGYAVRHMPFVYFDDVSGHPPRRDSQRCREHVRPYAELARDLSAGAVARYNFIVPDLCGSGHDACPPIDDPIRQSDAWLERELPRLMASRAYREGGAILVTWDESERGDRPIGLLAVSPLAKPGHASALRYSHASILRTVEEVLGVSPLLRGAGQARNLSDLFTTYP
jgi:hypothetical protein